MFVIIDLGVLTAVTLNFNNIKTTVNQIFDRVYSVLLLSQRFDFCRLLGLGHVYRLSKKSPPLPPHPLGINKLKAHVLAEIPVKFL